MNEKNLLVVDFDYFFRNGFMVDEANPFLYDWGHNESFHPALQTVLWQTRAAGFWRAGLELPQVHGWESFWQRFTLDMDTIYYADSNVWALADEVVDDYDAVWLYDAHHDAGYENTRGLDEDTYTCEDWMIAYHKFGAELHVRYPTWRHDVFEAEPKTLVPVDRQFDDGGKNPLPFHAVFVCRSGSWVPTWCEKAFWQFLDLLPDKDLIRVGPCEEREFNEEEAREYMKATDLLFMEAAEANAANKEKSE